MKIKFWIAVLSLNITFNLSLRGQNSLFNGDTVVFNYVQFDADDNIVVKNIYDSFKKFRKIFIDADNIVNWMEDYNDNELLFGTSTQKEILHFSDISDVSHFKFKVVKKRKKFYYETIGPKKEKIFEASFSTKKSTNSPPFFTIDDKLKITNPDPRFPYALIYEYETELKIDGNLIPCYRFTFKHANHGLSDFRIGTAKNNLFGILGVEVYFEKKTLLPIVITSKRCLRTLDIITSDELKEDKYHILFYRSFILPGIVEERW